MANHTMSGFHMHGLGFAEAWLQNCRASLLLYRQPSEPSWNVETHCCCLNILQCPTVSYSPPPCSAELIVKHKQNSACDSCGRGIAQGQPLPREIANALQSLSLQTPSFLQKASLRRLRKEFFILIESDVQLARLSCFKFYPFPFPTASISPASFWKGSWTSAAKPGGMEQVKQKCLLVCRCFLSSASAWWRVQKEQLRLCIYIQTLHAKKILRKRLYAHED